MELIRSYFPELTSTQADQLTALGPLYKAWNDKINVISRKDIDYLYEHHVLHSLALAKHNPFSAGMSVLDAGTGGGFPGIPLAILFPEVQFTLLDSVAKKIKVVGEIARALRIENINTVHARIEEYQGSYDLIISRAVSTLSQMMEWSKHLVPTQRWIILKGGDPAAFRKELPPYYEIKCIPISQYFKEAYFTGKYIADIKKKTIG